MTSDIPIVNPTEVSLVFINSSAAWYNTVGYYTYPTNNPPQSASDIKQIIAFPNTSPVYKTLGVGALVCGEEIKLKYWNEETQEYEDKFLQESQLAGAFKVWDSRANSPQKQIKTKWAIS